MLQDQIQAQSQPRCPKCNKPPRLLERVWRMNTGSYIRIYKCECGELIWDD